MRLSCLTYLFSLMVALFSLGVADAQVRRLSREAIDSIRNIKPFDEQNRVLVFEETLYDMGAIFETDTLLEKYFTFNVGNKEVTITRITTSCGCVVVDYPKQVLHPGTKNEIKVMFNPKGMAGTVNTDIFVYTTLCDKQPTSRLCVKGNILAADEWDFLPHKTGTLRFKQKEVVFDIVNSAQKPSMRILCANVGTTPLELSATLLPPYATFRTEPSQLEPGCEGDIIITIDGKDIPENVTGNMQFRIVMDGVNGSPLERTLKVLIKQINK